MTNQDIFFVEKATAVHGGLYTYENTNYLRNKQKVAITCKIHGDFQQRPDQHLSGAGCKQCKIPSKGERSIRRWLEDKNIKFKPEKTFDDCRNPNTGKLLRFDFYLPDFNVLIEFDGIHHFMDRDLFRTSLKEIQFKDAIKTQYAKDNSITLLRINSRSVLTVHKTLNDALFGNS